MPVVGADTEATNKQNFTPLAAAAFNGHVGVAGALVDAGASVDSVGPRFEQKLSLPSLSNTQPTVLVLPLVPLLHLLPPPLHPSRRLSLPVSLSLLRTHLPPFLFPTRAPPHPQVEARSPLVSAALNGHADVCGHLIERGADVDLGDHASGLSALAAAAKSGKLVAFVR